MSKSTKIPLRQAAIDSCFRLSGSVYRCRDPRGLGGVHRKALPWCAGKKGGFTLIEMLVVIAIIMLLVSMVTPAAQKALESARAVRCRSNLRTMGQALHVTVLESNGRIPRANDVKTEGGVIVDGEWFWHVGAEIAGKTHDEYVTTNEWREEETFACPSVKVRREGPALMQYGMNKYFDPSQSPPSKRGSVEQPYGNFRLSHVRRPSSTYLFGDKTLEDWAPIIHHQGTYLPDPRHNGHAYFVFVDGHVRGEKWPTTVERSHYDFLD